MKFFSGTADNTYRKQSYWGINDVSIGTDHKRNAV
jgi:hypothetical protein